MSNDPGTAGERLSCDKIINSKRWRHNVFVHVILILAVGCVVYSGVLRAPNVYDDFQYVVLNHAICDFRFISDLTVLNNLPLGEDLHKNIVLRPVAYLSFAVNYYLGGFNVIGYHIFNIIVHFINALLVYLTARLTFEPGIQASCKPDSPSMRIFRLVPLFAALIFISHPVQIQSVTYITQRMTSLVALFYLLSLALYIKSGLSRNRILRVICYSGSLLAACIAMKTKENAFTLPIIIVIYEYIFFRSSFKKRVLKLTPFILTMLIIPLTVMQLGTVFQHTTGSAVGKSLDLVNYNGVSRWDYLFTQFRVIITYLRLLIIPVDQHLDYHIQLYRSFFQPVVVLSFMLLIALSGTGGYLLYKSKRYEGAYNKAFCLAAFGIFWFFVTLSVESSIIPLDDLLVEQRVYLPSVGIILACVASTSLLLRNRQRFGVMAFVALFSVVVIVLSSAAYARNRFWTDPIALWSDTAHKNPQSFRAYQCLGAHYFGKGMFEECLAAFSMARSIDPGKRESTVNIAKVYLALNRFDEAEAEYVRALSEHPDDDHIYTLLAHAYIVQKKYSHALTLLQQAILIHPDFLETRIKLAELCEVLGKREQAIAEYMNISARRPGDVSILNKIRQLKDLD